MVVLKAGVAVRVAARSPEKVRRAGRDQGQVDRIITGGGGLGANR